jgi:hypothetical protein
MFGMIEVVKPAGIAWERLGSREHRVTIRSEEERYYVIDWTLAQQASPNYGAGAANAQAGDIDWSGAAALDVREA